MAKLKIWDKVAEDSILVLEDIEFAYTHCNLSLPIKASLVHSAASIHKMGLLTSVRM